MAKIKDYKDLIAWQKGMHLVEAVYRLSALFPREERFGLTAQMRRAAVGIASNIAEGHSRPSRNEYVRFLHMGAGSANEVETQALIAVRLGFVSQEQAAEVVDLSREVQRIVRGLVKSLCISKKTKVGI